MRFFVTFILLLAVSASTANGSGVAAVQPAISSASASAEAKGLLPMLPPVKDLIQLPLPSRVPNRIQATPIPHLSEFFVELDRFHRLELKSKTIESWVYWRALEPLVADYEDAMHSLDLANDCLDEALVRLISDKQRTLKTDPAIDLAKSELSKAEDTISFLIEIAKLDIESSVNTRFSSLQ